MKQYIKGSKTINATDKAYRLLYKSIGFKPYSEDVATDYNNMTVAKLKEELDEKGIEYTSRDTKDVLIGKLEEGD